MWELGEVLGGWCVDEEGRDGVVRVLMRLRSKRRKSKDHTLRVLVELRVLLSRRATSTSLPTAPTSSFLNTTHSTNLQRHPQQVKVATMSPYHNREETVVTGGISTSDTFLVDVQAILVEPFRPRATTTAESTTNATHPIDNIMPTVQITRSDTSNTNARPSKHVPTRQKEKKRLTRTPLVHHYNNTISASKRRTRYSLINRRRHPSLSCCRGSSPELAP
jgi:hypothetical protein